MIQLPCVGTRHEMTEYNSSMESGSSAEETSSLVHPISNASEASMWEGWTQASNGDEVATSSLLPELMGSSRLAYHQTDMLSSWLSGFHPLSQGGLSVDLSHNTDSVDNPPAFMQEALQVPALCSSTGDSLADMYIGNNAKNSSGTLYSVTNDPCEDFSESYVKRGQDSSHFVYGKHSAPLQLLQSLDPESPCSPLALHNGLLHSFGGSHWDGGHQNISWAGCTGPLSQSQSTTLQLLHGPRETTTHVHQLDTDQMHVGKRDLNLPDGNHGNAYYNDYHPRTVAADHSRGLTNHLGESLVNKIGHHGGHHGVFMGSQGNYGWTPHYLKEVTESCVSPINLVPSGPDARENASNMSTGPTRSQDLKFLRKEDRISGSAVSSNIGNCTGPDSSVEQTRPGKHRLELVEVDGEDADAPPLKRPSLTDASQALWRNQNLRRVEPKSYPPSSSSLASQAMDIIAVGPALNTNGKPRARRGSATDPQSVYARHRRERINERLKTLQHLVPNGAKVDIVTMLEEAINYVKFLQDQLKLLKSDEFWIYATPNIYNGIDVSSSPMPMGLESSA